MLENHRRKRGADPLTGDALAKHSPSTTPRTVEVKGKAMRVLGVLLASLMANPTLLAAPEMVIPFFAAVGRLTMLAAREKLGKSTLAAFLAAAVSCGGELWGHLVKKGVVLWVGLEEDPGDAVRRFVEMGADPENIVMLPRLAAVRPLEQLEAEIVAHRPRLVVIDSLAAFYQEIEDENGAAAWTKQLMPLVQLARSSGAAIVLLHHANRAQGSYRGSSAIGAAMDMILEMSESTTDANVRHIKPRGRWKVEPYALRYELSNGWTFVGGGAGAEMARTAKLDGLQAAICRELAKRTRPAHLATIRKAVGGKAVDCDEALRLAVTAGRVIHLGKRQGYELPRRDAAEPASPGNSADQLDIQI
jgi:hypothetical protein